jgi:sugar (pentulose or hexulose) kinase
VEIVRAVLEAISYRFALIARALETVATGAEIVATGKRASVFPGLDSDHSGCSRLESELWRIAGSFYRGAALLALEAVGKIDNIEAVPVSVDEVFEPDRNRHACYQKAIERQEEFYRKLVS